MYINHSHISISSHTQKKHKIPSKISMCYYFDDVTNHKNYTGIANFKGKFFGDDEGQRRKYGKEVFFLFRINGDSIFVELKRNSRNCYHTQCSV